MKNNVKEIFDLYKLSVAYAKTDARENGIKVGIECSYVLASYFAFFFDNLFNKEEKEEFEKLMNEDNKKIDDEKEVEKKLSDAFDSLIETLKKLK